MLQIKQRERKFQLRQLLVDNLDIKEIGCQISTCLYLSGNLLSKPDIPKYFIFLDVVQENKYTHHKLSQESSLAYLHLT